VLSFNVKLKNCCHVAEFSQDTMGNIFHVLYLFSFWTYSRNR
jgi:hypothetical protein